MLKGISFKAQLEEIRKLKEDGPKGLANITYLEVPNEFKLLIDSLSQVERVNVINLVIEFGYVYMYALDGTETFIEPFACILWSQICQVLIGCHSHLMRYKSCREAKE